MNIEALKYFQYIAKYKNITQAAKHLYISQSTLSRHIMSLENELGVKLFERNNKMVTLTEAGKMLYQDSDAFINHMDSLIKNVTAAGKGHSGILKVTAPQSLYHTLSKVVCTTRNEYPDIKYFVESYEFNEIPLAVKYNLYNIGITYDFALYDHENLDYLPIDTDEFSFIFSEKYLEDDPKVTLNRVVRELPFLSPAYVHPRFFQQLLVHLQDLTGYKIQHMIDINTTHSLILNASLGLGFGLVPASWFDLLGPENHLAVVTPPEVSTKTDIVVICKKTSKSELTSNVFQAIKKLSAEYCAKQN
ncbi:MAG: LysR family transcriptional regulator [Lachnospiraceae bacterium]